MSAKFNSSVPAFYPPTGGSSLLKTVSSTPPGQAGSSQVAPPVVEPSPAKNTRKNGSAPIIIGTPRGAHSQRAAHKNSHRKNFAGRAVDNDSFLYSDFAFSDQLTLGSPRQRRSHISASHLNFSQPVRDYSSNRYGGQTLWRKAAHSVADKAHYVNANFRFIVNPCGDYKTLSADPNIVVPWHLVLQVLVSKATQSSSCPICLNDKPVAARMARCGHVFCLACLMRMLESDMPSGATVEDESKPKKKRNTCPLCFENVSLSDARPVRWIDHDGDTSSSPAVGRDVVLRLVKRKAGSILALPRDGGEFPNSTTDIPWHFAAEVMDYARVMKGTEDYITAEFEREVRELEFMEQEDGAEYGEDSEWSSKAIGKIFDNMEVLKGIGNAPRRLLEMSIRERSRKRQDDSAGNAVFDASQTPGEVAPSRSVSASMSQSDRSRSASASDSRAGSAPSDAPYYFYQPRDASYTFLSPLDIRILKTAFGSFSAFPSTVLVRVEHILIDQVVDDEVRKRTKYLSHLPNGCLFSILECDWTDVVKPEILAQFAGDLESRRKARKDKDAREERARVKAQRAEEQEAYNTSSSRQPSSSYEDSLLSSRWTDSYSREDFVNFGDVLTSSPQADSTGWPSLASPGHAGDESIVMSSSISPPTNRTTIWGTPAYTSAVDNLESEEQPSSGMFDFDLETLRSRAQAAQAEENSSGRGNRKSKKSKKLVLLSSNGLSNSGQHSWR
ncbi:uncharacterized protein V1518DRAFT_396357 [Limtongia smithiae]|uniref:uncharacterized protein n=1 Tax=Limtongia smithiae TaxID=1125753 RepID=UPI0034CDEDE4